MALMGHINLNAGKKARFDYSSKRAFSVPYGGDKRDRTADLLNAILEQNYLQHPYFGIIVLISLETKKSQNL